MKAGLKGLGVVVALTLIASVLFGIAVAQTGDRYCEVRLNACPETYKDRTYENGNPLMVPLNAITIAAEVDSCNIKGSETIAGEPPSIMFVIDNSSSMVGNNGHDPTGNRYRVMLALIDSIYSRGFHDAEVGFATFSAVLQLNAEGDGRIARFSGPTAPPTIPNNASNAVRDDINSRVQGFFPPRPLNEPINPNGYYNATRAGDAGATIRGLYRSIFEETGSGNSRTMKFRMSDTLPGTYTDISLGFEAALQGFDEYSKVKNKDQHYIIFISDGDPNVPLNTSGADRNARRNNYVLGEMPYGPVGNTKLGKVPTTYTIFLNRQGDINNLPIALDTVSSLGRDLQTCTNIGSCGKTLEREFYSSLGIDEPATIGGMTYNIRNNDYSGSNKNSNIWLMESNYQNLIPFMMDNVIDNILNITRDGTPTTVEIVITVEGEEKKAAGSIQNGVFRFNQDLPLDTAQYTKIEMNIKYDVKVDTVDRFGNDISYRKDSTETYRFDIVRTANPGDLASQNLEMGRCGEKPRLTLKYDGQPVDVVKSYMDRLVVELDNSDGLFSYESTIKVWVFNTEYGVPDSIEVTLTRASDNIWRGDFPRVVRDDEAEANRGNTTLEHKSLDTIGVFFRNPKIPLDTIRISRLYLSHYMALYKSETDPPIDSIPNGAITIRAGEPLNIYARLFDSDNNVEPWKPDGFDAANIKWTLRDTTSNASIKDASITNTTGSNTLFSSTTANTTYYVTATYDDGKMKIVRELAITVIPGDLAYIEVVFKEGDIVPKQDTTKLKIGRDSGYVFTFTSNVDKSTFFAVERDIYGNVIRDASGATGCQSNWQSSDNSVIPTTPVGCQNNAEVRRLGNNFASGLKVTVSKNGISSDVRVVVEGEPQISVGPNPFVPSTSDPDKRLEDLTNKIGRPDIYQLYEPILKGQSVSSNGGTTGGGVQSGGSKTGILIAATAPSAIKPQGNTTVPGTVGTGVSGAGVKYAQATVMIYDAVGNVVWRSKPNDIIIAEDQVTFGFVWDGKNAKGRVVGPGTYLVRMVGSMQNGQRFSSQRKIGVTKDGSVN